MSLGNGSRDMARSENGTMVGANGNESSAYLDHGKMAGLGSLQCVPVSLYVSPEHSLQTCHRIPRQYASRLEGQWSELVTHR